MTARTTKSAASIQNSGHNAYDRMIYESYSYPQTHPAHLYTVGTLFGLTPPDFRKSRILEIGCAGGGNLFPVALACPEARLTGFDLSAEQIALADRHRQALDLKNVDFVCQDIMAFDLKKNAGAFDYIVCHGIFSWVPAPVRERILELCQRCLSQEGLAVISYNTLPGWNAVRSLRDMMLFHTKRFDDPAEKIRQSRAMLEFLLESVPAGQAAYRSTIEEELKLLKKTNDSYLFHDHLEQENSQFYFNEFANLAFQRGLSYVGDTSISSMFVDNLSKEASGKLKAVNNIVQQEQYMDFILNRRFRSSLLCHKDRAVNRNLKPASIMNYALSTLIQPDGEAHDPKQPVTFRAPGGATFTSASEIAATLYLTLSESGKRPVWAADLVKKVQKKLKLKSSDAVEATLIQAGLQLALRGFIALHSDAPAFVEIVSEKPVASPLARYQASLPGCASVTNVLSATIGTDVLTAFCLALLDGTNTTDDLIEAAVEKALSGAITISKDGKKLTDAGNIRSEFAVKIPVVLKNFAGQALLIG